MSDSRSWIGALFGQSQKGSRDEGSGRESGRAGLRQSLDRRVELAEGKVEELRRLRAEVEEAKQSLRMDEARQSLLAVEEKVDRLEERLSKDLSVVGEVGEEISEAAKMSKRVAVTFQRAEEDLKTLEEIGSKIRRLEEDFQKVIKRVDFVEWRGIFRSIGIVTAGILAAILLLFSTTMLSPWAVPVAWRVSSAEEEKIEDQERIERAFRALSEEDRERVRDLLEKGEKQAQSRQEELSEELDPRGGEQTEGK
jgi:hypothetical protein